MNFFSEIKDREANKMSALIWFLEKVALGFVGFWLYEISPILFWVSATIFAAFFVLDVRRQAEISRCLNDVKEFPAGPRKEFIMSQLRAERTRLTFWVWVIKNSWDGWGNPPKKISPPCELMDDGPAWVRKTIQWSLWLTEHKLFPFILNGFLSPLVKEVEKVENEVLTVFEPGCGKCGLMAEIANLCRDRGIPAVFVAVDIESSAIEGGKKWLRKNNVSIVSADGPITNEEWNNLLERAAIERTQIVRFIRADLRKIEKFLGDTIHFDLAWLHHFIHHLNGEAAKELMEKIGFWAEKWYVLEEFRSWLPIFLIHCFIWYFPCHLETAVNSILSNRTEVEWMRDFDEDIEIQKKGFLCFASNQVSVQVLHQQTVFQKSTVI